VTQTRFELLETSFPVVAVLGFLAATSGAAMAAAAHAKSPAASEAGWQKVLARKGGCAMSVPADWKVDPLIKGSAGLPDNSASAVVSLADSVSTLAEVKPVMEGMFKPTKTFDDSAHRLWYEYQNAGAPHWYVGVPVKGGICGAQISFKAGKEDVARKVAASVGPG
jgi:hypothetical protein